jgi:hypothetical protein
MLTRIQLAHLQTRMPSFLEFRKSAIKGDAGSQCDLAMLYMVGDQVEEDAEEAAYWWAQASEQGHAASQFNLGNCYYHGRGVNQDFIQAFKWFRAAAQHAHDGILIEFTEFSTPGQVREGILAAIRYSFINLGRSYGTGRGVEKDDIESYAYYNLGGVADEVGRRNIATLERKLSRVEIYAGQRRTKELKAYFDKVGF